MTPPSPADLPTPDAAAGLERIADALHDLLHARALSIGLLEVAVEVNDWYIDGEALFTEGPDIGFSLDVQDGDCRYCELLGDSDEQWLEHQVTGLDPAAADRAGDEARTALAITVLDGLLTARRPLLKR